MYTERVFVYTKVKCSCTRIAFLSCNWNKKKSIDYDLFIYFCSSLILLSLSKTSLKTPVVICKFQLLRETL